MVYRVFKNKLTTVKHPVWCIILPKRQRGLDKSGVAVVALLWCSLKFCPPTLGSKELLASQSQYIYICKYSQSLDSAQYGPIWLAKPGQKTESSETLYIAVSASADNILSFWASQPATKLRALVSLSQYYYLHAIHWLSYTQPSRIFGDQSWES